MIQWQRHLFCCRVTLNTTTNISAKFRLRWIRRPVAIAPRSRTTRQYIWDDIVKNGFLFYHLYIKRQYIWDNIVRSIVHKKRIFICSPLFQTTIALGWLCSIVCKNGFLFVHLFCQRYLFSFVLWNYLDYKQNILFYNMSNVQ
jgi:hypothetical protein